MSDTFLLEQEMKKLRRKVKTVDVSRLDAMDIKIEDISEYTYDVKQNHLYDINHVDIAINDIMSKMVQGDKMLLPYGNYNFTSTLNLNIPEGCSVILEGILNAVGNFTPAIKLTGGGFKFEINKLLSNLTPLSDYSNIINNGLVLGSNTNGCSNCEININIIDGFSTGIYCCPDNGNGVQYVKTNFNYIRNCKTPILLSTGNISQCWVNENTFMGGRVNGYYGIKFIKGLNQTDPFNNNKFYNIGFEDIKKDALMLSFAYNNSITNTRMCEALDGMYITDDSSCSLNLFIISHILPLDKISLVGSLTRIIAPLSETSGGSWLYSGFVINSNGIKKFDIIEAGYQLFSNVSGNILPSTNSIAFSTDTSAIVLTLPKDAEFKGNEIVIKDNWHVNSITINKYDGTVAIPSGVIDCYGRWILRRGETAWETYIIPYKMDVQASSTASDVTTLKADFNSLLSKLKGYGLMKTL